MTVAATSFWAWIKQLDLILRGETTSPARLREGKFEVPVFGLAVVIDALGLAYGACMGLFSLTGSGNGSYMQIPASMLKVPALFLLTLIVTLPSLYVFNALVGSRLTMLSVVRLLVAALAVMLAVLASLGPIVGFFAICTTSYSFIVLLNVLVYAIAGLLGLKFLLQTLHRMTIARADQVVVAVIPPPPSGGTAAADGPPTEGPPAQKVIPEHLGQRDFAPTTTTDNESELGPLDPIPDNVLGPHTRTVFRIWVLVFGLVGSQMGWLLRPFIGDPNLPFQWFRDREGNFFEAVATAFSSLF